VHEDGETKLSNLGNLCRYHHRAVHEGGFSTRRRTDGTLEFRRPDGELIEPTPPPKQGSDGVLRWMNRDKGIDETTCVSRWEGDPCDDIYIADLIIEQNTNDGYLAPY
jgi:hypothetical protein